MKDSFSRLHPAVGFLFFVCVISFTMFENNPVCLALSIICAFINAAALNGGKTILFSIKYLLPTAAFVVIINPVFNHSGATILTYLPWGNPLTLESVLYGFFAAGLICSVVLWLSSFNKVMTSDKLVYLFGKLAPSLSLLLSMAFRLVPKFTVQMREVKNAQKALGRDVSSGKLVSRFRSGTKILSVMISRSLENSIETADSMKSRGYGLKGRTAFSIFRFEKRDFVFLSAVVCLSAALIALRCFRFADFRFFPSVKGELFSFSAVICYIIFSVLSLLPVILKVWEGLKWKRLRSAI